MCLRDPVVEVQMVMLANSANEPVRFELLEFTGRPGAAFEPGRAGIQAIGYTVAGSAAGQLITPGGVVIDIRSS